VSDESIPVTVQILDKDYRIALHGPATSRA